jgi:TolB protein
VATPVVCEAAACHTATCVSATGGCESAPVPDGTACDDLDGCTGADACLAGSCRGPLVAEPGKPWLAFVSHRTGDYDVWLTRTDGSCLRNLTAAPSLELHPSWSPGGAVAFTSDRSAALRIWVQDPATGVASVLDTGEIRASSPAVSPDGRTVAFEGRAPGAATSDTDVYVVPTAGGIAPTPLAVNGASDSGPTWSPDGSSLYFVSNRSGAYEIHQVVVATGAVTKRTTGSRIVGRPVAGPGGDRLYFARTKAGSSSTEVVRLLLGTGAIQVVSSQGDSEPAVSPAGDRLALRTFRFGGGNAELVLVDEADGGAPQRLTDHPASDGAACFAPAP